MASLDDIWDSPATQASSSRSKSPSASPSHDEPRPVRQPASSRPLFLDSDSETEAQAPSKSRYASKPASNKPDIDAFFADLDDDPEIAFQDLAPSLDVAALKRQAEAKLALTPHQILPSSSPPRDLSDGEDGGRKKRAGDRKGRDEPVKKKNKRRPPLDEARLVSPGGFPALAKQAKEFRPKGKGAEVQDLGRLLNLYQFWAHNLYANTHFTNTVQRVEKLCHSKRMNVALSVWRDEAKGLINGHKIPGPDDPLNSSDSDDDGDGADKNVGRSRGGTHEPQDVPIATDDERSSPARSAHGASLPPSSPSSGASSLGALDDDFDIDAMIREDETARAQAPSAHTSRPLPQAAYGVPRGGPADEDEDAAMWDAAMDDLPDEPYVAPAHEPAGPSTSAACGNGMDEDMDEDMWDMVREMEAESTTAATVVHAVAAPSAPATGTGEGQSPAGASVPEEQGDSSVAGVDTSRKATNDEGWDEMYA